MFMKKLLSIFVLALLTALLSAQVSKTVNVLSAGMLTTLLTATERATVTNLTVSGIVDLRDFKIIRDSMPTLTSIDISNVTIAEYSQFIFNADGIAVDLNADGIITDNDKVIYSANSLPRILNKWINIISIKLPTSVTSLSDNAFQNCSSLTNIILPNSLTAIGNQAFQGCSNLSGIVIPQSVTNIGDQAFLGCDNLANINIPTSVISIGVLAFGSCSITVDNSNPKYSSLGGVLYNKKQTKIIYCPTSKTGSFIIPSTVDSIEMGAFYECNKLASISIPSSVKSIGNYAFYECSKLMSIYVWTSTPINIIEGTNAFININKTLCTLYVPINSKALYQAANEWKDFVNISEFTTAVNMVNNENIKLYPNHVIDYFSLSGINYKASLTILDLNGKTLLAKPITDNENIAVGTLSKGMYIVKIITNNGIIERKIMK